MVDTSEKVSSVLYHTL